jgi:oligo-1,6-glucosidase
MMRWWLDRGVDGFRMDVINMVSKALPLRDGRVIGGGTLGDGSPFYLCGPRIHEFLQEMHREVFEGRDATLLTVGEMPGVTVEEARLFTDPARREVDMVFQFEHVGLDHGEHKWDRRTLELVELKTSLARWQDGLADVGWNSLYWNNHDQPRAVSRFGDDSPQHRVASAKLLATVLHLHRGTPYVYQGEELGMTNMPFADAGAFLDIESVNYHSTAVGGGADPVAVLEALREGSRDNARSPVQWDASPHAGFTTGEPWFPVNPNHDEVNAEHALADPDSVFHHYRRLIELRHTDPVVSDGRFALLLPEHPTLWAFTRTLGEEALLVVANLSGDPLALPDLGEPGWAGAALVLGTHPDTPATHADDAALRPWEARVLRRA